MAVQGHRVLICGLQMSLTGFTAVQPEEGSLAYICPSFSTALGSICCLRSRAFNFMLRGCGKTVYWSHVFHPPIWGFLKRCECCQVSSDIHFHMSGVSCWAGQGGVGAPRESSWVRRLLRSALRSRQKLISARGPASSTDPPSSCSRRTGSHPPALNVACYGQPHSRS